MSHDIDSRYDSIECRNRIAALYIPLLAISMEVLHMLHGYEADNKEGLIDESVAAAISTSSVNQRSMSSLEQVGIFGLSNTPQLE